MTTTMHSTTRPVDVKPTSCTGLPQCSHRTEWLGHAPYGSSTPLVEEIVDGPGIPLDSIWSDEPLLHGTEVERIPLVYIVE